MIYTVNGAVFGKTFGNVLIHEHIGCMSNDLLHIFGKNWLDKNKLADFTSEILKNIADKYGVGLFVDGTPIDLGRDVTLLKSVSEKSGIPIVASTGLYHYPSIYTSGHSETEIASWFISEWENGMEETGIKPGILKCATDAEITADNRKRLKAMAIAQRETNLPIYVHSSHRGDIVENQLEILFEEIKNPEKVILGHTAQNPDYDYLAKLLDKGVYICMDQCHCTGHSISDIGKTLVKLCENGYGGKIMLSNDLCMYTDFGTRKNTGFHFSAEEQTRNFGHIFETVYESFVSSGGNIRDWEMMFKENPINVLDI